MEMMVIDKYWKRWYSESSLLFPEPNKYWAAKWHRGRTAALLRQRPAFDPECRRLSEQRVCMFSLLWLYHYVFALFSSKCNMMQPIKNCHQDEGSIGCASHILFLEACISCPGGCTWSGRWLGYLHECRCWVQRHQEHLTSADQVFACNREVVQFHIPNFCFTLAICSSQFLVRAPAPPPRIPSALQWWE